MPWFVVNIEYHVEADSLDQAVIDAGCVKDVAQQMVDFGGDEHDTWSFRVRNVREGE